MATLIASRLEVCFVERGFLEPSVDELRDASAVSLRTLYKYFASREAMVVGALEHRHQRYLDFIEREAPENGAESLAHVFGRIEAWMKSECGTGCLFLNALAAHPSNSDIRAVVVRQKNETRSLLGRCAGRPDLADALFLLHEGATAAWPLMGGEATRAAKDSALKLLVDGGHACKPPPVSDNEPAETETGPC
ncbi:MAG: TetR/AcrR family transcriptional regulator [Alphaproteobacteria bacterium]|nr:TetR/AcrR family transcriptional regulator [Alphaproteobacteria bacterium]